MQDPSFSTAYSSDKAFTAIWLPLISASILGIAGLYMNELVLTGLSALLSGMALFNWPLADAGRVVLRLTREGVDVDGIGHVPWNVIHSASLDSANAAKKRPKALMIDLKLPVSECIHDQPAMTRPFWQRKLGRTPTDKRIAIPLSGLFDPPEDVAEAFGAFLGDRFAEKI